MGAGPYSTAGAGPYTIVDDGPYVTEVAIVLKKIKMIIAGTTNVNIIPKTKNSLFLVPAYFTKLKIPPAKEIIPAAAKMKTIGIISHFKIYYI